MNVRLVDDNMASSNILEFGRRNKKSVRIWILDRLENNDHIAEKHRKIKDKFKDDVILPVDLIHFDQNLHSAITKGFGDWVITKSDQVSMRLIREHNQRSITMTGKKFTIGNITGGYYGSQENNPFFLKFEITKLQASVNSLSTLQQSLSLKVHNKRGDLSKLLEQKHLLEEKTAIMKSLELDVAELTKDLVSMENQIIENSKQEAELRERRQNWSKALEQLNIDGDFSSMRKELDQQIDEWQQILKENLVQLNQNQKLLCQLKEDTWTRTELINQEKGLLDSMGSANTTLINQISAKQSHLQELKSNYSEQLTKKKKVQSEFLRIEKLRNEKENEVSETCSELQRIQENIKDTKEKLVVNRGVMDKIVRLSNELLKKSPEVVQNQEEGTITCKDEYNQTRCATRKLLDKISKLGNQNLAKQYAALYANKKDDLEQFKTKIQLIRNSMQKLSEETSAARIKAKEVNEMTFVAVRKHFSCLFNQFVPTKQADLRKIGEDLEDGVEFYIANHRSDGLLSWKKGLTELSGGQRSLLGLSLILSIAKIRDCAFYLFDEIDSALDEVNTNRIAQVILEVFASRQVICISHHNAFQKQAKQIIQVGKRGHSKISKVILQP